MLIPPLIQPGDTLGIIAPSSPFDRPLLGPALTYLQDRGYRVREGRSLYARDRYLAGSDDARAADVNAMFADPEVTAIFVPRGGYGSARLLDRIDYGTVREHPKALVGFSDTTALQLALWSKLGLVQWTGAIMAYDVVEASPGDPPAMDGITADSLWDALERHDHQAIGGLRFLNEAAPASGRMVGGCLSLVVSLAGTPWMPELGGSLIFLEDVNEPPYRIDRMLNQLLQAGAFERVSGILFGRFTGCEGETDAEGTVLDVLDDLARRLPCPVAVGLPHGHGEGRRVLPIGLEAALSEEGTLRFEGMRKGAT